VHVVARAAVAQRNFTEVLQRGGARGVPNPRGVWQLQGPIHPTKKGDLLGLRLCRSQLKTVKWYEM